MNNVKNDNSTNSPFIVIIGLIVAIGRIAIGCIKNATSNEQTILLVMAIVNYIAFGFVLLFLYNGFYNCFIERLNSSGLNTKQKKKSRFVSHTISSICLLIYFAIGLLYVTKYYSSNFNDAISIFSLSISIANDGLIERYSQSFYKAINKIATSLISINLRIN